MSRIRGKDTKPEIRVRSLIHGMGFRFRLHRNDLPGRPDLVFGPRKKVIFVHGCFWHSHDCVKGQVKPVTRAEFWTEKRNGTIERDRRNRDELEKLGWRVLTIWECETLQLEDLSEKILKFLR